SPSRREATRTPGKARCAPPKSRSAVHAVPGATASGISFLIDAMPTLLLFGREGSWHGQRLRGLGKKAIVPPMSADPAPSGAVSRTLAKGEGWRLIEVICRSGPADRPFEEEHAWTSVSAVMSGVFTYRSAHGRALMSPGSLLLGNRGACFACGHEHGIGDRCVSFQVSPELAEETAGDLKGLRRSSFGS